MKKILLLMLTVVLTSSCAELFCDMFNYSKEQDKDKSGAGDDIYAIEEKDVNAYVICKSGWAEVYWCAPNEWPHIFDSEYRPRFWQQEARITPYPNSENPLVYICQYPEVSEELVESRGYWKTHNRYPEYYFIKEHCASWEVIASDKRVLPVLMAGEGGFPFTKPKVMGLLDEYAAAMESLKGKNEVMDENTIKSWENIHMLARWINTDRQSNMPSQNFDPGYYIPGSWQDPNYWLPTWEACGGGGSSAKVINATFYLRLNSYDKSGWGKPLENTAKALFGGKYPIDGYKCGIHFFDLESFSASGITWNADGSVNNPNGETDYTLVSSVSDEVNVTYYCLLPETTGCSSQIWCQNPEDWYAK